MASKPIKTRPTEVSVETFPAAVTPEARRDDARVVCALMSRLSGEPARMWGPSIVGFGVRRYRTEAGREGDMLKVGFAPRKPAMVFYVHWTEDDPLLARLGKFSTGKSCLYVSRLSDIDLSILEALIARTLER